MTTEKKTSKKVTTTKEKKPAVKTTAKKVASESWPKVVKGNHLTVYTFEDGSTKLEWDDKALLDEVRTAIMDYELATLKPAVKSKAVTRAKKVKG